MAETEEIQEHLDALYPDEPYSPLAVIGEPTSQDSARDHLFNLHQSLCQAGLELMKAKNQDYGSVADPWYNFRRHGALGIMVRLSDKLARLESFLEKGFNSCKTESVKDTVVDGINYLVLLYGFLQATGEIDERL